MSDFYHEMQGVASDLLSEFSQGVIQYQIDGPATGPAYAPVPGDTTTYLLNATARGVGSMYRDSTLIKESDLLVTAAAFSVAPTLSGRVIIDGQTYQIVQVQQVPAAGVPVAWKIVVRS